MSWQKLQNVSFFVFLTVIICTLLLYQYRVDNFDIEQARQYLDDFGIWAPLIFVIIFIIGTIFIPSTPFVAIAGILFGFKYGLIYTLVGGLISAVILFEISRRLGKTRVEKILTHRYLARLQKYNRRLESGGAWDLVVLRIIPIVPFNVLNILMGVSKIGIGDYIIGTIFGLIPSNMAAVYFGSLLINLF